VDLFALTQKLMSIDSTTGHEGEVATFLSAYLRERGFATREFPVAGERRNVFAALGTPRIVMTTHMDCVPPFIAPQETDTHHLGRGSCDAKGPMAAMLTAGEALREKGVRDFGFLFVVGEETDSSGAKNFAQTGQGLGIRYFVNGEPTGNVLMRGHKGVLAMVAERTGVPGHSAYPELFDSALHPLLHELDTLLHTALPSDENFGASTVNIGQLEGGLAANVVAAHARAEIMVRLARPLAEVKPLVFGAFSPQTQLSVRSESDPADIFVPEGYASEIVRFGSDVPHLRPLAKTLLVGPGSIHDAHTAGEKLAKSEQHEAVRLYQELVRKLLDKEDS
jgi:acetylornithine deacetylase